MTIAMFSRATESWNGLMVEISPCCLDFIHKSVFQA
ncbi:dihydroorotate dehydrogenase, partial [Streptococcus pneumoniae]